MPITMVGSDDVRDENIEAVEPAAADAAAVDVAPFDASLMVIRPSARVDDRGTAVLHAVTLDGMFVRFGVGFLRAYHASFRRSPYAVSFVIVGPDGVVGFLVGTLDNEAHYQWLARHALPSLGLRAVVALVRRPRVAMEALRTRRKRYWRALTRRLRARRVRPAAGSASTPSPAAPGVGPASTDRRVGVLTHVAVVPEARGSGAGRRLVTAFEDALTEAGAGEARLITDPAGGAPAFYRRLGWSSVGVRAGADGTEVEEFLRTW